MSSPPANLRPQLWFWGCVAAASLLVLFQNHGLSLLPDALERIPAESIRPLRAEPSQAYVIDFDRSAPDLVFYKHSRITLYEDGSPLLAGHADIITIALHGAGLSAHEPGRIVFGTPDKTDPRTNGREYYIGYPRFQQAWLGFTAAAGFLLSIGFLWRLGARAASGPAPAPAADHAAGADRRFRLHLIAAATVFTLGLYLNTGTLTPYGNNGQPYVDAHGYLYNTDHPHFVTLFKFVDGQPRSEWDGAIFFRRILFPVFAYPFMKLCGFEVGGVIASGVLNLSVFIIFLRFVHRRIGARGASLAAWLHALYPGTFFWSGLPYFYSVIVPCSLLLTMALWELDASPAWKRLVLLSAAMGLVYLAYDLIAFFLPASLLLLVWRRRWLAALLAAGLQLFPLVAWLLFVQHGLRQDLATSNSSSIAAVIGSYRDWHDVAHWPELLRSAPGIALDIFFGAHFMFLPLVVLGLIAVNAVTSRVRPIAVETVLALTAVALFLFCNLAPPFSAQWPMRGTWLSRLYQPCVPIFFLFAARWAEALPPLPRWGRRGLLLGGVACGLGASLVVFGPILGNPFGLSEECYYRFYDLETGTNRPFYEYNLRHFGRRPMGF